ncbi:pheromone-regulated protein prm10 [Cryptotrichosporon argae]
MPAAGSKGDDPPKVGTAGALEPGPGDSNENIVPIPTAGDHEQPDGASDPADRVAPLQAVPSRSSLAPSHEAAEKEDVDHAPEATDESPADSDLTAVPSRDAPTGDIEKAAVPEPRADPLRVHFKKRRPGHHVVDFGSGDDEAVSDTEAKEGVARPIRRAAAKLVRHHTGYARSRGRQSAASTAAGGSTSASEGASDTDTAASYGGDSRPSSSRSRRCSAASSASGASSAYSSDDGDDDAYVHGRGGVLSALFSLYRQKSGNREQGAVRSLLRGELQDGRRRRWAGETLFAAHSAGSGSGSERRRRRRSSGDSARSFETGDTESTYSLPDGTPAPPPLHAPRGSAMRVHRNRRRQQLPHRSQNLDDPYIPSPKYSNPLTPGTEVTAAQALRSIVSRYAAPATWLTHQRDHIDVAPNRTLAALVVSTQGLQGFASPTLAHLAPATGRNAETSTGQRKLAYYEGVSEFAAREEDADRADMEGAEREGRGTDLFRTTHGHATTRGPSTQSRRRLRRRGKRTQKEMAVTRHVASIIQRKKFIEALAKSVVNYGAPSHSVESWLAATADILQVEASFIYFPSVLIVAFRDSDVHSTDILFIRPKGGLELYRLALVHDVYRKTTSYSRLTLIITAAFASGLSARFAFSGSFIDMLMAGALGSILAIVQFVAAERHQLISNVFEIGIAGIISFVARGLGTTEYFCYDSLASAAIVLILPGWHICLGSLELGSKNVVAGAIRIVWAVLYTLFLSFGLTLGSEVWDAVGTAQYGTASGSSSTSTVTVTGSFVSNDTALDTYLGNGTFTFTNASTTDTTTVTCYRNPAWTYWWYTEPSDWWLFLITPAFAFSLAIWFRADWRGRDIVVMVVVASAGYAVDYFVSNAVTDETNIAGAVSAFTIGVLGNLYSRLGGGSAFPSMVVGILLEVPNAIAAAGGLDASSSSSSSSSDSSSSSSSDDSAQINTAVLVSIRMIQVGIGLAIGLFAAALVVYPFGKRNRYIFSY